MTLWNRYKNALPYIIIGTLVFFLFVRENNHSTFIEDRDREFKHFQDSIVSLNDILYEENVEKDFRIDSLGNVNDWISSRLTSLDGTLVELDKKLKYEIDNIDNISDDSNIVILAGFLSQDDDSRWRYYRSYND